MGSSQRYTVHMGWDGVSAAFVDIVLYCLSLANITKFPFFSLRSLVVSFASCLDVAAISMDMGEALDTNKELATVGICNVMSGALFGFTGSYIDVLFVFNFPFESDCF